MTQYQLIVFDWDGTLMDSTGHIVNCMRQAIQKLELALSLMASMSPRFLSVISGSM